MIEKGKSLKLHLALKLAIVSALTIGAGVAGAAFSRHFGTSNYTISYADFIAVMLSAVTLLITLLGFILALLAYIGWRELNDRIDTKVGAVTDKFLTEGFEKGNHLHAMLEEKANQTPYRGVDPLFDDEGDNND